jgi:hypothetical protein
MDQNGGWLMKRSLVAVAVVALLLGAGSASSHQGSARPLSASARTVDLRLPPAAPAGDVVFYGHIKSLTRKGKRFELRFDPAWLLMGVTAQRAAVADKVLPRGEPVPNDNYTRDESHRLLTFLVPPSARATVLTRGPSSTRVSVAELAEIVKGRNPRHRPLFGPVKAFGFWIRVHIDTVRSLDEQYHP